MEPKTGKILAMVSKPDFDPNTVEENWNSLSSDTNSVLLNRATQGQYAPGSTFKVVTLLEFMREIRITALILITVRVRSRTAELRFIVIMDMFTDR